MKKIVLPTMLTILFTAFLGACNGNQQFALGDPFGFIPGDAPEGGESSVPVTPIDPDDPDVTEDEPPPICDPFGGQGTGDQTNGIIASLSYRAPDDPGNVLSAYLPESDGVSWFINDLYLNELNKPTSPFDEGFVDGEGNQLKNSSTGEDLIEYFALFMRTKIKLADGDPEGEYQFALIADDGAVMHLDQGYGLEEFINNDGTHPSRVKCSERIEINSEDELPVDLGYFQAPRYHIAIMLLWRHGSNLDDDPFCTSEPSGNGYFFDSNQTPPEPTQAYQDFLDRGWKVLRPANYLLPATAGSNPCS